MKLQTKSLILTAAMAGLMLPAAAQTTPVAAPATVNQRKENQQDRIANGIQSGELTAGETKNLEGREANLNHQVRADRQANGGTLTPQERHQVNQRQNNLSQSIYDDKHNAANQKQQSNKAVADAKREDLTVREGVPHTSI